MLISVHPWFLNVIIKSGWNDHEIHSEISARLQTFGYTDIETEHVENQKGTFIHLRWLEQNFPIEITLHHWTDRQKIMISSITNLPMKRATLEDLRKLLSH